LFFPTLIDWRNSNEKWTPLKRHSGIYEYPTAKGKRYGVRRSYTNAYKEHHEWTHSGFTNWHEADIALKQFESDLANGTSKPPLATNLFGECILKTRSET